LGNSLRSDSPKFLTLGLCRSPNIFEGVILKKETAFALAKPPVCGKEGRPQTPIVIGKIPPLLKAPTSGWKREGRRDFSN